MTKKDPADKAAEAEIERLYNLNPEVVEAVIQIVAIASPLAGPQRILAEIVAVMGDAA